REVPVERRRVRGGERPAADVLGHGGGSQRTGNERDDDRRHHDDRDESIQLGRKPEYADQDDVAGYPCDAHQRRRERQGNDTSVDQGLLIYNCARSRSRGRAARVWHTGRGPFPVYFASADSMLRASAGNLPRLVLAGWCVFYFLCLDQYLFETGVLPFHHAMLV